MAYGNVTVNRLGVLFFMHTLSIILLIVLKIREYLYILYLCNYIPIYNNIYLSTYILYRNERGVDPYLLVWKSYHKG